MKTNAECFDLVNSHKLHALFAAVESNDELAKIKEASKYAKDMLETVCKNAEITQITNECKHLSIEQRNDLFVLLNKYESSFDRTLGE